MPSIMMRLPRTKVGGVSVGRDALQLWRLISWLGKIIDIADTGNIMPPKTTWFEPKLRSGLVIHELC
ncbi:MAG: hypothetical protein AUK63_1660 [bacterium P3]|nr:MAG: hypothetical protein AUK63_1660 [bacterium P3]